MAKIVIPLLGSQSSGKTTVLHSMITELAVGIRMGALVNLQAKLMYQEKPYSITTEIEDAPDPLKAMFSPVPLHKLDNITHSEDRAGEPYQKIIKDMRKYGHIDLRDLITLTATGFSESATISFSHLIPGEVGLITNF